MLIAVVGGAVPEPREPLRVMTYNVLYSASEEEVGRSLDVIEQEAPDILCLRELTPRFANAFRKRLGAKYPHTRLLPRKGTWGMGIASKYPVTRAEPFAQKPHRMPGLEAEVRVGRRGLKVACVHLMAPGALHAKDDDLFQSMAKNAVLRGKQGEALVRRYAKEKGPLLLLGDMNEERSGEAMKAFAAAGFDHACDGLEAKCGATWPGATSMLPAVVEIDHILARRLTLSDAKVLRTGGSDHYPVRAVLAFPP
ncbi:endonuclease/exonuclease/phosphatase family protein [Myxococcus sp. K15C18031901]|uniref:endonuclease/exonuclease/phosphatase family protein n=1 Tax=Myxococcus dinghuensis TaxID=2906761 RepID=UPI0020A7C190|nr:endonuclease/exonuclease/phosphatase family protein [Myxococcus dinghuensis]MCP3102319.1 endonuclease/exonuclease/phosphatase family protein [Myxococcus dinghuensis]